MVITSTAVVLLPGVRPRSSWLRAMARARLSPTLSSGLFGSRAGMAAVIRPPSRGGASGHAGQGAPGLQASRWQVWHLCEHGPDPQLLTHGRPSAHSTRSTS